MNSRVQRQAKRYSHTVTNHAEDKIKPPLTQHRRKFSISLRQSPGAEIGGGGTNGGGGENGGEPGQGRPVTGPHRSRLLAKL